MAASKAVWTAALNAEIDIAAVIKEVVENDRNAQMPVLTMEQRVEIAIQCALHDCKDRYFTSDNFTRWAERWLDGTDRSAAAAAWSAARETGWEASWDAAWGAISEAAGDTAWREILETVWTAASKAVWAAALNAEIDITAVIEEVVENDRNAQIIEEGKCVTN